MASGTYSKIRVVWLCHFSNQEVRNQFKTKNINDFSPWINLLIDLYKNNKDIDLYIVSPNIYNNQESKIKLNNINFIFYKIIPTPNNNKYLRKIYNLLKADYRTNFWWSKYIIKRIVDQIKPDIVHLHGAENPYYSAGILPLLKSYPTFVTIQGFIRQTTELNFVSRKRILIEDQILKSNHYFGVRTNDMTKTIMDINPTAEFFIHNYPVYHPILIKDNIGSEEPYDCIFFGRICKDKGIEDLLLAISKIKIKIPEFRIIIIGEITNSYEKTIKEIIRNLEIQENIIWKGFLPDQNEIYKFAYLSKLCILPTYHDIIPGTIIESMLMKLPVISYAVGGIPEINETDERIILVKKGDIEMLATKIFELINHHDLRKNFANRAYTYAKKRFDNNNILPNINEAYKAILNN